MFKTGIDVPNKSHIVDLLNELLADAADLKMQAKQAHWNVKGKQFYSLHLLFDEIAGHFDGYADVLAERAVQLGGVATGTLRQAAKATQIPEADLQAVDGMEHVRSLSKNMAKFANSVRESIDTTDGESVHDMATSDIFIEITRQVDKDLWFLEAHIQD